MLFEALKKNLVAVVNNTMGVQAIWTPHGADRPLVAVVLFKDPTETSKFLGVDYSPINASFEYSESDLPGLKASVDQKNDEIITIGANSYGVLNVRAIHDGDILLADIQLI